MRLLSGARGCKSLELRTTEFYLAIANTISLRRRMEKMLKSLKNLTEKYIVIPTSWAMPGDCGKDHSKNIADEIQAEVDRYYLLRPLYEDGEPAGFGDEYIAARVPRKIEHIAFYDDDKKEIRSTDGTYHYLAKDERLKRLLAPDTQEQIDKDAYMYAERYCNNYHLSWDSSNSEKSAAVVMRRHLLARQRKLDGVM